MKKETSSSLFFLLSSFKGVLFTIFFPWKEKNRDVTGAAWPTTFTTSKKCTKERTYLLRFVCVQRGGASIHSLRGRCPQCLHRLGHIPTCSLLCICIYYITTTAAYYTHTHIFSFSLFNIFMFYIRKAPDRIKRIRELSWLVRERLFCAKNKGENWF